MLEAVRARIEAMVPQASQVLLAEEITGLDKAAALPSRTILVAPGDDDAGEAEDLTGGHRQLVRTTVVVAWLVRHQGQPLGAARISQGDAIKAQVEAALAGWAPTDESFPMTLVSGASEPLQPGVTLTAQQWGTQRWLIGSTT